MSAASLTAEAPGKAILFGEHAVVYGHTAIVLALPLTTRVTVFGRTENDGPTYNGSREKFEANPYLREARRRHPDAFSGRTGVTVTSSIPPGSGLGSSAAFVTALTAVIGEGSVAAEGASLHAESFLTERGAQGVGSPVDTAAATAGGVLGVGEAAEGDRLWSVPAVGGHGPWIVARLPDPGWTWVVAYTGVPKDTGRTVTLVGERLQRSDGRALLESIGEVSRRGQRALCASDRPAVARAMEENQRLLLELGVGHPRSQELLDAVKGHALAAKITGAGAGGSVLALPAEGRELDVARAFARAGGVPFIVRPATQGVQRLATADPSR